MLFAPGGLVGAEMMPDTSDIAAFVIAITMLAVLAALLLPRLFRHLTLRQAVPILALIGPVLAIAGSMMGSFAGTLSGDAVGYVVMVAVLTGVASVIVGWRLAGPLAADLDAVATTVGRVAAGDSDARTGLTRADEVGALAETVDQLGRSLATAEAEREVADAERRSVVSALSHDLRTPLASLLASVDALEDDVGEPAVHLPAMRRNVLALEHMVEDLFLLARADSGRLALHPELLDLAELIDEALEALAPAAAEKQVRLSSTVTRAVPVLGDDAALGRVLRNLLDNAIRHAPDGGLVTVECRRSAPHDGEPLIEVEVGDDGAGFSPEFAPRAVDRFSQADGARSRTGGAGLGLAIAQTLMIAHRGSIEVLTGPGGRVVVRLPGK